MNGFARRVTDRMRLWFRHRVTNEVLHDAITALAEAMQPERLARDAVAIGAKFENQRILDIEALALPGHEALIAEMKRDPSVTVAAAALKVVRAEQERRSRANVVELRTGGKA